MNGGGRGRGGSDRFGLVGSREGLARLMRPGWSAARGHETCDASHARVLRERRKNLTNGAHMSVRENGDGGG
jgi:hypothetical protein